MDYVASMFQSGQGTDGFQFCPIPCQHTIQQEELILIPSEDANVVSKRSAYSRRRRKAAKAFGVNDVDIGKPNDNNKNKNMIHRDIERQRRQEMTTLYATLRSLIPFEYLKVSSSSLLHMKIQVAS